MAAGEFQFLRNIGAVRFDGARADEQFRRDLLAGFLFGHEFLKSRRSALVRSSRPGFFAASTSARLRRRTRKPDTLGLR